MVGNGAILVQNSKPSKVTGGKEAVSMLIPVGPLSGQ